MLVVEVHALGNVRGGQDLLDGHGRAGVDQLHHQLVVGDAELAEAAEAGARVHQEVEQHPALRVEHLVERELRSVALVHRVHQLLDVREALLPAEMLEHHSGR